MRTFDEQTIIWKGGIIDFQAPLRIVHRHVWKFTDGLKQDSSLNHLPMAQMIACASNSPQ